MLPESMPEHREGDHNPTIRVLRILEALAFHPEGLTLSGLSRTVGASKSTIVPVVRTMVRHHFISVIEGTSRYGLGVQSLLVGASYAGKDPVLSLIHDEMDRLVRACSETCQLGILECSDVLYIDRIDSPEPIRLISSIGKRLPASCSAIGKALLSGLSDNEIRALYPSDMPRLTTKTIVNIDELIREIRIQDSQGIFWESEEATEGIVCYAVPLKSRGKVVAAASVSIPAFRFTVKKRPPCSMR